MTDSAQILAIHLSSSEFHFVSSSENFDKLAASRPDRLVFLRQYQLETNCMNVKARSSLSTIRIYAKLRTEVNSVVIVDYLLWLDAFDL